MTPTPPQPHFPSPYARPTVAPTRALAVRRPDGARLAVFAYGDADGAPVLLAHGNGEEHGIFGPTVDSLVERGFRVVALDSRGQGKSTLGSARLTYELLADDALSALDALGVRAAHVLGFSDGAIEALLMARDHAERVLSVTALGANLTPEGVIDDGWDLAGTIAQLRAWAARDWPGGVDPSLLTPTPAEAAATADLLQLMLDEPHIDAASLAAIGCPVTVVAGEFDVIRDDETVAIARAIPGARLIVVPGQGHSLPKHVPDLVTSLLLDTIDCAE